MNLPTKEFFKYLGNKGLLEVLKDSLFENQRKDLIKKYKNNFLFIQKNIDLFLQSLIDKISTIPYTVRCICKIIFLLISFLLSKLI